MKYRVGDSVVVTTGRDKGKAGEVSRIMKDKVLIEGINQRYKHIKSRQGQPGEKVEFFAPIHISNIAIVDPKTKSPSRIGYLVDKAGKKTRVAKKSGQEIVKAVAKKKAEKKETPKAIKA